uniref:cytochrome c biogenesis protein n=1 Tax=Aliarcobacter cryaerophilus TaxID=28198 RepID=UPI0021CC9309
HLTDVDPQITSLVPDLKSYWLKIHVSILTASYGFFGLSDILGFLTLIMFIFRKNRAHFEDIIKNISAII